MENSFTQNNKQMKYLAVLIAVATLLSCGSSKPKNNAEEVTLSPIMNKALNEKTSWYYADFANFPKERKSLPIGVFDSGTGGLTVLERLLELDQFNNITGKSGADGIPDFSGENFTYLADQANMPYGNYSSEGKDDYLKELAVKDALFLLSNKFCENAVDYKVPTGKKLQSKIVVIACNTATAYGFSDISNLLSLSKTGVRVIGVVNAGSKALLDFISDTLVSGQAPSSPLSEYGVGVLATVGTIASGAYEKTINKMNDEAVKANKSINIGGGKSVVPFRGKINIVSYGAAGFAESVDQEPDFVNRALTSPRDTYRGPKLGEDENSIKLALLPVYNFKYGDGDLLYKKSAGKYTDFQLNSAANYARFHLVSLIEKYRATGTKAPLKAIILGCTHYPFLTDTLKTVISELKNYKQGGKYIYRDLISDNLTFIDPAVYTAIECYKALREDNLLSLSILDSKLDAYISVPVFGLPIEDVDTTGNLKYAFKYGRKIGTEDITTVNVPFSRRYINQDNLSRIELRLPYSFKLINKLIN